MLLLSNFDTFIGTSKRIAENSSFLVYKDLLFLLTKSKILDTIKINQRNKGELYYVKN